MRIKWYLSDLHACGPVRGEALARVFNKYCQPHSIDCKTEIMESDFYGTDIMIFQRQHTQASLMRMKEAKDRGIKVIYELDDDLFNVPPSIGKAYNYYGSPAVQSLMQGCMSLADMITVTTKPLAKELRTRTDIPIAILQNALVLNDWVRDTPEKEHITIGWMASNTHDEDSYLVDLPLAQILDKYPEVRLTLLGSTETANIPILHQYKDQINAIGWQGTQVLPEYMSYFDIGIAPVTRSLFNDSKSGIKVLQYWASSTPIVCSDSPCYDFVQHGQDGFLASSSEEWFSCLDHLVSDTNLRELVGEAGREKLRRSFNMRQMADCWLDLFNDLMA